MKQFWTFRRQIYYAWLSLGLLALLAAQLLTGDWRLYLAILAVIAVGALIIVFSDRIYRFFALRRFVLCSGDIALYRDAKQIVPSCVLRKRDLIIFDGLKPKVIDFNLLSRVERVPDRQASVRLIELRGGRTVEHILSVGKNQNDRLYHMLNSMTQSSQPS